MSNNPFGTYTIAQAYAMGTTRARAWFKRDVKMSHVATVAAWRAVGYADAVMQFAHEAEFMALVDEWARGFDTELASTSAQVPSSERSAADSAALKAIFAPSFLGNPQFKNIERAPYELGRLLQELPADMLTSRSVTHADLLVADAARQHAENANASLMRGLEALGQVMTVAGDNEDGEIGSRTVAGLGGLLQHVASEARFLQETESYLEFAVQVQAVRLGVSDKGGEHA